MIEHIIANYWPLLLTMIVIIVMILAYFFRSTGFFTRTTKVGMKYSTFGKNVPSGQVKKPLTYKRTKSDQRAAAITREQTPIKATVPPRPSKIKTSAEKNEPAEQSPKTSPKLAMGYYPNNIFDQLAPARYPIVKMPRRNIEVRIPRHGVRGKLRGRIESQFEAALQRYLPNFLVKGDCCLVTRNHGTVEPDIGISFVKADLNLWIDIEIDEPYSRDGVPLHVQGTDEHRDAYLTDRGWIVCRFTEHQVVKQSAHCIAFISRLINAVCPSIHPTPLLNHLKTPDPEAQWTAVMARNWWVQKYREKYLNIDKLGIVDLPTEVDSHQLSAEEKLIEATVESTFKSTPIITPEKVSPDHFKGVDDTISVDHKSNEFFIRGILARSIQLIANTKVGLRADASDNPISLNSLRKCLANLFSHNIIQAAPLIRILAESFYNTHRNLTVYRSSWNISDPKSLVAGTVDLITKNSDGTYNLYAWFISDDPLGDQLFSSEEFNSITDAANKLFNKHCFEQNAYKLILEKNYKIHIRSMHLIVFQPKKKSHIKVPILAYGEKAAVFKNIFFEH